MKGLEDGEVGCPDDWSLSNRQPSARSLCWGVADASAIDVAVAVRHRIGAAIGGAYEALTR